MMGLFDRFKQKKEVEITPPPIEEPKPKVPLVPPSETLDTSSSQPTSQDEVTLPPSLFNEPQNTFPQLPQPDFKEELPNQKRQETSDLSMKIELILTKVDNIKLQLERLVDRIERLERNVEELRKFRYY